MFFVFFTYVSESTSLTLFFITLPFVLSFFLLSNITVFTICAFLFRCFSYPVKLFPHFYVFRFLHTRQRINVFSIILPHVFLLILFVSSLPSQASESNNGPLSTTYRTASHLPNGNIIRWSVNFSYPNLLAKHNFIFYITGKSSVSTALPLFTHSGFS